MKIGAYLFTVNKNNNFRLNPDEVKDVQQDICTFFHGKTYNDEMIRRSILTYYIREVEKKTKREQAAQETAYLQHVEDISEHEVEQERSARIDNLDLNPTERKIVEHLVKGYSYKEIRRKFKLTDNALRMHVHRIKQKNTVG